jgi:hypothetical protein
MSSKSRKRATGEAAAAESEPRTVIRVRRGALRRFDQLKQKSGDLPVEIKWDRRTDERRARPGGVQHERREADRRQPPPFTWEVADFVVVGDRSSESPSVTQPDASQAKTRK